MTLLLQYLDTDLSTVLLDMNSVGATWAGTGFAVMGDPDLGTVTKNLVLLQQQGVSGAVVASLDDDVRVLSFRLASRAASLAQFSDLVLLHRQAEFQFNAGGTISMQMDGETSPRYFEALPSGIPPLLHGQKDAYLQAAGGGYDPIGIDVAILVQPYAKLPVQLASVNKLTNGSMLVDSNLDGTPESWVWVSTTNITNQAISNSKYAYRFDIATAAARTLQHSTVTAAPGDIWSFAFDAEAADSITARSQAQLEFLTGGGAVLATATGTLTVLSPASGTPLRRKRLTVTSVAAPATTASVRASVVMNNASGTSVRVYLASAQLELASTCSTFRCGSESVTNQASASATFGHRILLWNPGNVPALTKVTLTSTDSAAKFVQFRLHPRSGTSVNVTEWLNSFSGGQEVEGWTLGTDTSIVAVGAASGGNVAQTTFASPTLLRRAKTYLNPVDPAALTGSFDVYTILRATGAGLFGVQCRFAGANVSPATDSLPVVPFDTTNIAAGDLSQYSALNLGTVTMDPTQGDVGLLLELWARRDSGAGSMNFDVVFLMPVDESPLMVSQPGFAVGQASLETWSGTQMVAVTSPGGLTAGTFVNVYDVLNTLNNAGGTPPAAGFQCVAGRHTVTFDVPLFESDQVATKLSEGRVRNVTGAANVKTVDLKTVVNQRWTHRIQPPITIVFDVPGDAATTDFLQFQVVETAATATGRQTDIKSITHQVIPYISGGGVTSVVVDGVNRQVYSPSANSLFKSGDFFHLKPGWTVLSIIGIEVPHNGYEYVTPLEPLGEYIAARALTTAADVTPRVSPL